MLPSHFSNQFFHLNFHLRQYLILYSEQPTEEKARPRQLCVESKAQAQLPSLEALKILVSIPSTEDLCYSQKARTLPFLAEGDMKHTWISGRIQLNLVWYLGYNGKWSSKSSLLNSQSLKS